MFLIDSQEESIGGSNLVHGELAIENPREPKSEQIQIQLKD
jgi:hypothetical protein